MPSPVRMIGSWPQDSLRAPPHAATAPGIDTLLWIGVITSSDELWRVFYRPVA